MAINLDSKTAWGAAAVAAGVGVALGMAASKSGKKDRWTIARFATPEEARSSGYDSKDYRIATIHETMGPNFKPILWVCNRPFVRKESK